jgi:hypothetical protein
MRKEYRLVYRGQLLPGLDAAEVIANLAALFHVAEERIAPLLDHVPSVIKQHLDIDAGNRYLEALAEAGLITHLEATSADAWDGSERRHGQRRERLGERRHGERGNAIRPDRRQRDRRNTH